MAEMYIFVTESFPFSWILGLLPSLQDFKQWYSEYLYTLYFVHVCKCFSNVDPWKQNWWAILKVFHFNFARGWQFSYSILVSASRCTKTRKFPEIFSYILTGSLTEANISPGASPTLMLIDVQYPRRLGMMGYRHSS